MLPSLSCQIGASRRSYGRQQGWYAEELAGEMLLQISLQIYKTVVHRKFNHKKFFIK